MIINVSGYDFDRSSGEISRLESGVSGAESRISSAVSDSKLHMSTCDSKVSSRITNWERKLSELRAKLRSLKDEESKLKSEIERVKSEIERLRSEISSVQSQLASLRPPRQVTYSYQDENGNTHTKTVTEDPDGPKRAQLQARLAELQKRLAEQQQKLNDLQAKLREVQQKIALVTADISTAESYIALMKETKHMIAEAKSYLGEISQYVNDGSSRMYEDCSSADRAVDELRTHFERYNSKSYMDSPYRGTSPTLRIPELGGAVFGAGAYVAGANYGSNRSNMSEGAKKQATTAFPAKMRLKSESSRIVDVVGVYTDKNELSGDIDKVKSLLGSKITFRVKKPITQPTPCFENVKVLADFFEERGFHGKMTAMGTRYTDGEGCLHFIS